MATIDLDGAVALLAQWLGMEPEDLRRG